MAKSSVYIWDYIYLNSKMIRCEKHIQLMWICYLPEVLVGFYFFQIHLSGLCIPCPHMDWLLRCRKSFGGWYTMAVPHRRGCLGCLILLTVTDFPWESWLVGVRKLRRTLIVKKRVTTTLMAKDVADTKAIRRWKSRSSTLEQYFHVCLDGGQTGNLGRFTDSKHMC